MENGSNAGKLNDIEKKKIEAEIEKIAAEKKCLESEAERAKSEKYKLDVERLQIENKVKLPWYRKAYFVQALIAGLLAIPLVWFHVDKVIVPLSKVDNIDKALKNAEDREKYQNDLSILKDEKEVFKQKLEDIENQNKDNERQKIQLQKSYENLLKENANQQKEIKELKDNVRGLRNKVDSISKNKPNTIQTSLNKFVDKIDSKINESSEKLGKSRTQLKESYREFKSNLIFSYVSQGIIKLKVDKFSIKENGDKEKPAKIYFKTKVNGKIINVQNFPTKNFTQKINDNDVVVFENTIIEIPVSENTWPIKLQIQAFDREVFREDEKIGDFLLELNKDDWAKTFILMSSDIEWKRELLTENAYFVLNLVKE